jgi:uncharacterized protein
MNRGVVLIIFLLMLTVQITVAQEHSIKVIAKATPDSIIVRWAPLTPLAWQQLNKYGYKLERYTIVRDSSVLQDKPMQPVGSLPIKPMGQAEWERFIDRDDFVAISAQAIFGESFEVTKKTSNLADIVNQSRELESRFSYALLAADISPSAASLSGLRYVDHDIKANEMYLYRVYSMVPENILAIEMGFAYTGPREYIPIPPVGDVYVQPEDRSVLLSWEVSQLKYAYSGYFIERSADGGQRFARLNDIPYVYTGEQEAVQNAYATFRDSLSSNTETYHYRIIGISPFGEVGPPSQAVSGKGLDKFDVSVDRVTGDVSTSGSVELQWEFASENEPLIKGFEVERSTNVENGFKSISNLLPAIQRRFRDVPDDNTNYYRIAMLGKDGRRRNSFPILIQKEDSIRPVPPSGIQALIDSSGIVTLAWKQNTESDLLGYRVYRSNFKNSEFSQVTVSPIISEHFVDTLSLRNLTRSRYYKITAVDKRFNTSGFSSIAEVVLPDIIPPVRVTFTSAVATQSGIKLHWTRCSSEDVRAYRIYRKSIHVNDWTMIVERTHPDSTSHTDTPGTGITYLYHVVAVDESGLVSPASPAIRMTELKKDILANFSKVDAVADRNARATKLSWQYPQQDGLKGFWIYRAANDEPITLYKTIPADANYFLDRDMRMDTRYEYRLKAIYFDGRESAFSGLIKVDY